MLELRRGFSTLVLFIPLVIDSAVAFKITADIPSGPVAFDVSRVHNISRTSSSVQNTRAVVRINYDYVAAYSRIMANWCRLWSLNLEPDPTTCTS